MNLFRSEEHLTRWPLYFQTADDYVMPVADWADVFSVPLFRNRLDDDYLQEAESYLRDYRDALRSKGKPVPSPDSVLLTVMLTDIVGSTATAAELGDEEWRALLATHDQITRTQIRHFGGTEVKQTGDGFLVSFSSPTRAIRCATSIRDAAAETGLQLRIGIHSGECEVVGDDLAGIAVHIASRVAAAANPGTVLVSQSVVSAVTGSGIDFVDQGEHELVLEPAIAHQLALRAR
jgi:class 3 adenylate cyclase